MFRTVTLVMMFGVSASACNSAERDICDKVSDCRIEITRFVNGVEVDVRSCIDAMGELEHKDECADCVEEHTCAELPRECRCGGYFFNAP